MSRPGLLRQRSSYGPPLDPSHTFNGADPKVNAMRNSLSRPVTPLAPREHRKNVPNDPTPVTMEPKRKRRVSFSSPESPLSPLPVPADVLPAQPSPTACSTRTVPDHPYESPGPSEVAPRHASDPGPASGVGWLYQFAHPRERSQSVPGERPTQKPRPVAFPLNNSDYIEKAIQMIAELVPRERHGLHTIECPQDKIRAEIDANLLLRRNLESAQEMAEYLPNGLAHSQHVYQLPLRYLYHIAATKVERGSEVLNIPVYMAFAGEQLIQRRLNNGPSDLGSLHKKSAYHNLIAALDSRHTDISRISDRCDTGQISQVLHHFLSGLPEPPLEPTLFRAFFECCFLASRGESSVHCATATVRAKRGELSAGEVGRIKIARILFCLMPKAHSDALEYLLSLFTILVRPIYEDSGSYTSGSREKRPPTNFGDIAKSFGWDVCAPRDAVGCLASIGMLGLVGAADSPISRSHDLTQVPLKVKERAEATVQHMSCQVLWWLLCYWSEIRGWRDDHGLFGPRQGPTGTSLDVQDDPATAQDAQRLRAIVRDNDKQIAHLTKRLETLETLMRK